MIQLEVVFSKVMYTHYVIESAYIGTTSTHMSYSCEYFCNSQECEYFDKRRGMDKYMYICYSIIQYIVRQVFIVVNCTNINYNSVCIT